MTEPGNRTLPPLETPMLAWIREAEVVATNGWIHGKLIDLIARFPETS